MAINTYGSFALKGDGTLWFWGTETIGGTMATSPMQIGSGFASISAGGSLVAIKHDGTLWTGYADREYAERYGMLGDGSSAPRLDLKQIGTGYLMAVVTTRTAYALKKDGTMWSWGFDFRFTREDRVNRTPIQIGDGFVKFGATESTIAGMKADGSLWQAGDTYYGGEFLPTVGIFTSFSTQLEPIGFGLDGKLYEVRGPDLREVELSEKTPFVQPPTRSVDDAVIISEIRIPTAYWSMPVTYDVIGKNLPDGMQMSIGGGPCNARELAGGSVIKRSFTCTIVPYEMSFYGAVIKVGNNNTSLSATLKDRTGFLLSNFSVPVLKKIDGGADNGEPIGDGTSGYICPTKKKPFDTTWIQSHANYWAAASAHDAYVKCTNTGGGSCEDYLVQERKHCSIARATCLAMANSSSDCPG